MEALQKRSSGLLALVGIGLLCGCARINGDPFWISSDQHEVTLHDRVYALGDTRYDLKAENLPFAFTLNSGTYDFGCYRHEWGCGCLDSVLTVQSVFQFEIRQLGCDIGSIFQVSNGVFRLIRQGDDVSHIELRYSPYDDSVQSSLKDVELGIKAVGAWMQIICFPPSGVSISIREPKKYGAVMVLRFKRQEPQLQLVIQSIEGVSFYRYPWL